MRRTIHSLFPKLVGQLWEAMDAGSLPSRFERKVKRFNGKLFKGAFAIPLERGNRGTACGGQSGLAEVEPAIFGTLLEQALDEKERARLGAHYTPRVYVERLVVAAVIEPLRQEWARVQTTAERLNSNRRSGSW